MSDRKPSTHVTAAIREGVTRLDIAFYTPYLQVMVLGVGSTRPILDFYSPEGQVSISTTGAGPVTANDVTLAREIADAAARYLAECERLHTEHPTDPDQADESAA
ncbi:hypothetical protein [Streptosporangium canum]|uniref:hypothetical protein n=1 Tax=Streptosporangium canum TaxID=324952 RepID=UPI00342B5105